MTFAFMTSFIPIAYIYNLLPISKVALSFSFYNLTYNPIQPNKKGSSLLKLKPCK